ncbi:hypothetical protein SAMN05444007_103236 [Cribrihabitans marinus]|uniref:Uncharacterized protein n=1 Tax=Cribrihabitans marinus TaxID=1227549 RepID=A0A1H6VQX9_9RHOB|nr:hypothetical protein [Cribrihabitans marinus]GGH25442.1 hypothetical protein GCM10010973_12610 [Cribrihabitans marinus]SEJ06116.1 hypothetical protein SAMN05444007_103236 [Cribrihabitans marinus]
MVDMTKEREKFEKDFKKTKPQLKALSAAQGTKMKKQVLSWLDETWKLEDKLSDTIVAARKSGVTGTRAADFIKEKAVAKALKDWKAAVVKHHGNIDELTGFSNDAQALHDELARRTEFIEKDLKKSKTGMKDMKIMATVKEAKRALPDLKKAGAFGSDLPVHVVFYARKLQQSVEVIVKQALKKADPKEFPKALQPEQRKRTVRTVTGHERKVLNYCRAAEAGMEKDIKKAAKALDMAKKELEPLEKLHDEFTSVAKKMRKEIAESKDKAAIVKLMKSVNDSFRKCDAVFDELDEKIDAAQAQANS